MDWNPSHLKLNDEKAPKKKSQEQKLKDTFIINKKKKSKHV